MAVDTYEIEVTALNWVGEGLPSPTLSVPLSIKTSGPLSVVSGDGTATISANVNAQVDVDSYDTSSTDKATGGDLFFIEVKDECFVVNSFYCEPSST